MKPLRCTAQPPSSRDADGVPAAFKGPAIDGRHRTINIFGLT
jgi:hypothetical protein